MRKIVTKSADETKNLGEKLGKYLFPGSIVSLVGDLGSGKTCFVQGLARELKIKEKKHVTSPSFVLVREYQGRIPLYHLDFYRLDIEQIHDLALEEYFYKDGVTVMEWGDKVEKLLPEIYLEVNFEIVKRNNTNIREIELIAHGEIYQKISEKIQKSLKKPVIKGL